MVNANEFSLKYICDQAVEMLKSNAGIKNITIHVIEEESVVVFADANMLSTILRNLISNAIKYTNKGGVINITSVQSTSAITISVSDNGTGLSPEILSQLFNHTQKLSLKGTANEKGTGLGLLLCKMFVEKHGGKIWAESEPGQGSIFKFTLPLL